MKRLDVICFSLCFLAFGSALFAQTTYAWKSPRTGDWGDAMNWTPSGVPGPGDMITQITVSDTVYTDGAREIAGFQSNGVIILSGNNGSLTLTGNSVWRGGVLMDATVSNSGVISIEPGATLKTVNGMVWGARLENGITLQNKGIIDAKINFVALTNSTVLNEGLFQIDGNLFFGTSGGNRGYLVNSGTIRKVSGTSTAQFTGIWEFTNQNGIIEVDSGELRFSGGGHLIDGTYHSKAGAELLFSHSNDTLMLEGTLSGLPDGEINLGGGSHMVGPNGATVDFQGNGFRWISGSIIGGGVLTNSDSSLLVIPSGGTTQLRDNTTILNLGQIRAETGFSAGDSSVVDNRGLFDLKGSHNFTASVSSPVFLQNRGVLQKSAGANSSNFSPGWNVTNFANGIIEVASGTLKFGKLNNKMDAIIQGIGTIHVPTNFSDDGIISPGPGPGLLTHTGAFLPSPTGVLKIELGGKTPGMEHDQLHVNTSSASMLEGMLEVSFVNGFTPANGDTFVIMTANGVLRDSFQTVNVPAGVLMEVLYSDKEVKLVVSGFVGIGDQFMHSIESLKVYPNPFRSIVNLEFALPVRSNVKISIHDLTGRKIAFLTDQNLPAGSHTVKWEGRSSDAHQVLDGTYIYRIQTDIGGMKTGKILLVR